MSIPTPFILNFSYIFQSQRDGPLSHKFDYSIYITSSIVISNETMGFKSETCDYVLTYALCIYGNMWMEIQLYQHVDMTHIII